MIIPEDDQFHLGSTDPYWNESAWFGFTVPDRDLTGWVYFYHRPNMRYSVGGIALWDPSGENQIDCLYYDWGNTVPLPPDADMFDFSLDNGLTVACRKPLQSFKLDFAGDGCTLDLTWDALHEPRSAGKAEATTMPGGAAEWGKGHYNQAGHIYGSLTLRGEDIPVDCLYLRDHSWGPRRFGANPRGDFASVVASERSAFCVLAATDLPRETDPCVGVADPVAFGWYMRDGETSRLVSAHRTVTSRDAGGRPLEIVVDGTDELGRTLHAVGRTRNALRWNGYAFLYMFWCMTEWEFDGETAIGEEQDYFPIQQARRFLRALA
ncbi:DUF7065 domain-containing protein [Pseudonocardia spinosispora]|uniref:DUF7065 domain-containing protein n=1 Tax=Pseudonocardia spinosispora TaxID=103441 RepID=UPI0003FF9A51|nr:hypothetical protein [Pseudonocardia spinosispora]